MTKRNIAAALLLCVFTFTTGCQAGTASTAEPTSTVAPTAPPTPEPTPSPTPAPDPIAETLSAMTVAEQVGQLFVVGFEGTVPGDDVTDYLTDLHAGGVILFKRNVESATQLTGLTNAVKDLNPGDIPLFVGVDQEGGMVERMPPEVKRLPNAYDVGASADPVTNAQQLGEVLAAECAALGFNLDFAPSFDVWSNPNNTVIGKRAFGSEPALAAAGALACLAGLQDGGIIPTPKHFPGHGDTDVDSHVGLPVVTKPLEEWKSSDFVPFYAAMDGRLDTLMVSHIVLNCLDEEYPATLSKKVITGFLREEQGFDGVVFTDDMTMGAITEHYGLGEACVLAVEAGCDVLLVCHGWDSIQSAYAAVLEAVESGRISEERLQESVYRILSLKASYGLRDESVPSADVAALNTLVDGVWAALKG